MPGSNERALEKAKTIAADALIFDLEDAVAPDAKRSPAIRSAPRSRTAVMAAARSSSE
jgi:citrate lyase subunit beta / citryl-CoA lyase